MTTSIPRAKALHEDVISLIRDAKKCDCDWDTATADLADEIITIVCAAVLRTVASCVTGQHQHRGRAAR